MCSSIRICQSPAKDLSYETGGTHAVTVHGAPRGRKAYIQWDTAWVLKGISYGTAITTPLPCTLRQDTFHLGLGRPEPRYPAYVVVTLFRLSPSTPVTATLPRVPRYGSPRNPEVRTRGWIYRRQLFNTGEAVRICLGSMTLGDLTLRNK